MIKFPVEEYPSAELYDEAEGDAKSIKQLAYPPNGKTSYVDTNIRRLEDAAVAFINGSRQRFEGAKVIECLNVTSASYTLIMSIVVEAGQLSANVVLRASFTAEECQQEHLAAMVEHRLSHVAKMAESASRRVHPSPEFERQVDEFNESDRSPSS